MEGAIMDDIIIRGGTIVDGTGKPGFQGDIAVRGGRIRAIGDLSACTAKKELDAGGLVVAPGFIDVHTHGRSGYEFTDGDLEHLKTMCKDKLSEGVTSWLPTTLTLGNEALAKAVLYKANTPYMWNSLRLNAHCGLSTFIVNTESDADTKGYKQLKWWHDVVSYKFK